RQYSGDSSVIGKPLDIAAQRFTIVGVVADKFRGLSLKPSDVWLPVSTIGSTPSRKPTWYESKNFNGLNVVVRLPSEAEAAMLNSRATEAMRAPTVRLINDSLSTTSLSSIIDGRGATLYGKEVAISTRLAGVAAVILLIACANIVNLLLARAHSRQREIAVRLALGVSRMRLLSQLLIESTVLSLISGAFALAIAFGGATLLRKLLLPDVQWTEGAINPRVAVFTALLALVVGFLAGLVPALQATRPDLITALKSSVRDGGRRSSKLRTSLLITQAALSVVLLVGAGVFVRSLRSVESVDTGFDISQLSFATIRYDRELGSHNKDIGAGLPVVAEQIRRLSGVETVALAGNVPMWGFSFDELFLPGRDSLPPAGKMSRILAYISPDYFKAVGLQVLRGRDFSDADVRGSELVIAMNENMAKNFWPGEDPLTKCVIVGERTAPCRRVVAIVSPAHFSSVIEDPSMLYYLPLSQAAEDWAAGALVIRSAPGKASQVAALVHPVLQQFFGDWALPRVVTMEELIAPQMRPWRTGAALFTAAGMLALLVAAIGVYSSVAYTISQRTREMGVRAALGASSGNIMRLVVSEGVRVITIGIALGVLASLALGSIVSSMLYNTSPRDPFVLVASTTTLLLVTIIACSIPAWRAARIDPLQALSAE
ncbi:MAG: FtsX-like permease family protein, partial [Gemmatimonadaceae bacterium]